MKKDWLRQETAGGKKNNCMDISSDKQAKSHPRNLGMAKGNLKWETELPLKAAQNNAIKNNYV